MIPNQKPTHVPHKFSGKKPLIMSYLFIKKKTFLAYLTFRNFMIFYATEGSMFSLHFGSFQSLDFTKNFQITKKENNYKIYHQRKKRFHTSTKTSSGYFFTELIPFLNLSSLFDTARSGQQISSKTDRFHNRSTTDFILMHLLLFILHIIPSTSLDNLSSSLII